MTCLGCNFLETSPVTLTDGRVVCSSCPEWRHECEVRYLTRMGGHADRQAYLGGVLKMRGADAWKRLRDGAWAAMQPKHEPLL